MLQLEHGTTKDSLQQALINNPLVAQGLFRYFEARFRPNPAWQDALLREEQILFPLRLELLKSMALVKNINDDRILRTLFNLIDATVRSNFHQRCLQDDYFIAIKINSLGVINMPAPKPLYEIYVHSFTMEGIHLRAGQISRGGIRWSDRPDDFRTEILGLMQTQVSKNALIIPTGSKGGFVVKNLAPEQDFKQAGKHAYLRLMRGLLDLTDNYRDGAIVPPSALVVHDDPDPYLVVAADKGTASFSDLANAVSKEYEFWLGDAFASGGSHGYDHKVLGITARGAWECVRRHFQELGKDIQAEAFTVIGIGSMDGDVFGNGMLLSPCIRLLAAFSGQHIFIDPQPLDSAAPFNERQRLFALPGSTWDDYDRSLISVGGGVFCRADKDIPVSEEVRNWLGIRYQSIDGEALIQHLLKTPVDLLWLGGIGTYVKASSEKAEDVGDHSNDTVRVDACDLRALVVGEGANLGFTQKARVEYSLGGGRINTDAVDNSAGVDTSDHEVNLKILLVLLHKQQLLADYQHLFLAMTDGVCRLVLADNIAQSLCLSLDQRRCASEPGLFIKVAERLEAGGFLDRAVESFPQTKVIQSRTGQALARPELAILMSASKMFLTAQIQKQAAAMQHVCYAPYLQSYFPAELSERFKPYFACHPLAKEITATTLSNYIINRAGCGFLSLDVEAEQGGVFAYVNAYLMFDQVLQAEALRQSIQALGHSLPLEGQYQLLLQIEQALLDCCDWVVLQGNTILPDYETIDSYRLYLAEYESYLKQASVSGELAALQRGLLEGVPVELAKKLAVVFKLRDFPFVVALARELRQELPVILSLSNDINQTLGLHQLERQLQEIPRRDYWVTAVCNALQADLQQFIAQLVRRILQQRLSGCADYLLGLEKQNKIKRYRRIYQENQKTTPVNLLAYVTLIRALENLLEN